MLKEFDQFALRGGMVDMAVGVINGGKMRNLRCFGKDITTMSLSLVVNY